MTWSGSSSTRWCCAPMCRGIRRSPGAGAGAGVLAGGARASGRAVRAAGRGPGPGPVTGPAPAVPGHAHRAEQRPAPRWTCPGCGCRAVPAGTAAARFDLDVAWARPVTEGRPAGLRGHADGGGGPVRRGDRADHGGAAGAGAGRGGGRPAARPWQVEVLDRGRAGAVVQGWNDTAGGCPAGVGAGAGRGAGGAVRRMRWRCAAGMQWVTYGELVERAGRLAGCCGRRGAGPERWSGCAWTAGAGDGRRRSWGRGWRGRRTCRWTRATRRERLAFMLADSRAAVVVTRGGACPPGCPASRWWTWTTRRWRRRRGARPAGAGAPARAAGVRDLHLGVDRDAEGGGGAARRGGEPGGGAGPGAGRGAGGGGAAVRVVQLRRLGAGRGGGAGRRRGAGGRGRGGAGGAGGGWRR